MENEPTNAELGEGIQELSKQVEALAAATTNGFAGMENRFDRLDGSSITTYKLYQDLETRVVQLEKAVESAMS